jgi:hypothetical protein
MWLWLYLSDEGYFRNTLCALNLISMFLPHSYYVMKVPKKKKIKKIISYVWPFMIIMYMWKQCCVGFIVVYMYCHWKGWDPIKQFNPVTFGSIPKPVPRFQRHMQWSFLCSVNSAKMRSDCWFCWYWWIWWPLLFKISFHICNIHCSTFGITGFHLK